MPRARSRSLAFALAASCLAVAALGAKTPDAEPSASRFGFPVPAAFSARGVPAPLSRASASRGDVAARVPRAGARVGDSPGDSPAVLLPPAPRAAVRGELRACGGAPLPRELFVGAGPSATTLCLEQTLPGATPRQVRRGLDVTAVTLAFDGAPIDPKFIGDPELALASEPVDASSRRSPSRGVFDWVPTFGAADEDPMVSGGGGSEDDDAAVRFNLTLAGLAPFADGGDPGGTAGSLVATVAVQPAARYYYEIVWYELELVVPTFYSGAVETIVKEGEKLGLDYDEIDYRVDNLVEGSATFFPCTNFIAGPFCEEAGITA